MKKKLLITISIMLVLVVGGYFGYSKFSASKKASKVIETISKVTKGDIKVEISGSGVIKPLERYDITPLVNGTITESTFEEGQQVKKGDILYRFDATEMEGNIEKANNSITKLDMSDNDTRSNIDKTVIYATDSGRLTNFSVKVNDNVGNSKIADIFDDSYRIARIPFNKAQIDAISVGQTATVTSSAHMSTIGGTVSTISKVPVEQADGSILYDVDIKILGTNSLSKDTKVSATIGTVSSGSEGKIYLSDTVNLTPEISGKVTKIYVSNNDYVTKGQKLLELDNEAYVNTLNKSSLDKKDAIMTLESQQKKLEDYNIKSPIDGIVLKKSYKKGDTINSGTGSLTLMVVADMTKVKFEMKIDELDIAKMKIGQIVNVVSDALPDKEFSGKVSQIAGEGTAANGVSNYVVEVTIDNPGELKSGMNITAKTVVAEKQNVLMIPSSAISKKDSKAYVTLPSNGKAIGQSINVEIGLNNKDNIEVISGLKEGDLVVIPTLAQETTKSSSSTKSSSQPQGGKRLR